MSHERVVCIQCAKVISSCRCPEGAHNTRLDRCSDCQTPSPARLLAEKIWKKADWFAVYRTNRSKCIDEIESLLQAELEKAQFDGFYTNPKLACRMVRREAYLDAAKIAEEHRGVTKSGKEIAAKLREKAGE